MARLEFAYAGNAHEPEQTAYWLERIGTRREPLLSPIHKQERAYRYPPRGGKLKDAAHMLADPCSYCGEPSTQYDHIEPIHRGGRNRLDNLTRACYRCNNSKRTRPLLLWLASRLK